MPDSALCAGGPSRLAGEVVNRVAEVNIQHVPDKGAGPSALNLIDGHFQMSYSVPIEDIAPMQSGKLRTIAVTGRTHLTELLQLPSFDKKLENDVAEPVGTSRAIIDKMSAEIGTTLALPAVRDKLDHLTPEQFGTMIKSEIALYLKGIKAANIRMH